MLINWCKVHELGPRVVTHLSSQNFEDEAARCPHSHGCSSEHNRVPVNPVPHPRELFPTSVFSALGTKVKTQDVSTMAVKSRTYGKVQ
jgi:hypothetical protein